MADTITKFLGSANTIPLTGTYQRILNPAESGREGVLFHIPAGATLAVNVNSADSLPWYEFIAAEESITKLVPFAGDVAVWVKGSGTVKFQEVNL